MRFLAILFFSFFIGSHTWAAPKCEKLFDQEKANAIEIAQVLQDINEKAYQNKLIGQVDYVKLIRESNYKQLFSKKYFVYWRVRKLIGLLNEAFELRAQLNRDEIAKENYQFDILVNKFLNTAYLLDPEIQKDVNFSDRYKYDEARKALIKVGIKEYLTLSKKELDSKKSLFVKVCNASFGMGIKLLRWAIFWLKPPESVGVYLSTETAEKLILFGEDSLTSSEKHELSRLDYQKIYNYTAQVYILALVGTFSYTYTGAAIETYQQYEVAQIQKIEKLRNVSEELKADNAEIKQMYSYQNLFLEEIRKFENQKHLTLNQQQREIFKQMFRKAKNLPSDYPLQ